MSAYAFPGRTFAVGLLGAVLAAASCARGTVQLEVGGGTTTTTTGQAGAATSSGGGGSGGGVGDAGPDGPVACNHASDCAAFTNACNVGACLNNMCIGSPMNEGGPCDDGLFCTTDDVCTMGTCTGIPMACAGMDACHIGTCDEATKACTQTPGNDNANCTPTDFCFSDGFCSSGSCVGSVPMDCSFLDDECNTGTCVSMQGCMAMPLPNGTICDNGLFCQMNDVCTNGVCAGTPLTCPPAGGTCQANTCVEADFACEVSQAPDGTACSTGNTCVTNQACTAGSCIGGTPVPDGTACAAPSACVTAATCTAGKCAGTPITMCINGDGCCPAGCTAANDSDCTCSINLALMATPSMSPGGAAPGHGPEELNNGVGRSQCGNFSWIDSNGTPSGGFFELDWAAPVTIASFYIEAETQNGQGQCGEPPGRNILSADVQTWNGSAWVTAQSFSGKSGDIQLDINPPIQTTKLRLYNVTDSPGNGNAIIWEWHVFGAQGCIPPAD